MQHHLTKATLALAVLCVLPACEGRDPLVTQKNRDAVIEEPPPPPPPEVRTLGARALFGTMPVANRFEDPLLTFTGSGWFGFANDFSSYAVMVRKVGGGPTQTPFLQILGPENPSGATLVGQVKTATTPLHVEVWVGRDGDGASFDSVEASLVGVFVGQGERAIPLTPDDASRTSIEGRTWLKLTADVDEGPVGWSYLAIGDTQNTTALYVGGAVAADLDLANANAALRLASRRATTPKEQALVRAVQERTRQLASARAPQPLPPMAP